MSLTQHFYGSPSGEYQTTPPTGCFCVLRWSCSACLASWASLRPCGRPRGPKLGQKPKEFDLCPPPPAPLSDLYKKVPVKGPHRATISANRAPTFQGLVCSRQRLPGSLGFSGHFETSQTRLRPLRGGTGNHRCGLLPRPSPAPGALERPRPGPRSICTDFQPGRPSLSPFREVV